MNIRLANVDDQPWIKTRYEEQGYLASNFSKETIAVAEIEGKKAGVGRLVPVDDDNAELGGMFVEEFYRGQGVAKGIIDFLLERAKGLTVYCIPFSHVVELYKSIGFEPIDVGKTPQEIQDKYNWCQSRYDGVGLLVKKI